jgi:hypothetical protein
MPIRSSTSLSAEHKFWRCVESGERPVSSPQMPRGALFGAKSAWLRMAQPALVDAFGIRCPCGTQGLLGERRRRSLGRRRHGW